MWLFRCLSHAGVGHGRAALVAVVAEQGVEVAEVEPGEVDAAGAVADVVVGADADVDVVVVEGAADDDGAGD